MNVLLPPLREDLQLKQSEVDHMGRQVWVIHDPSRNRFFSLDWLGTELLKRWFLREPDRLISNVNRETTLDVESEDLADFTRFLAQNELLQAQTSESTARLISRRSKNSVGVVTKALKHYLFLRVPLVNPEPALRLFAPIFELLSHRYFSRVTLFVLFLGLFQLSRNWDAFIHSFSGRFNLTTAFQIGLVIVLVKILHEFGHAYSAFRRGCHVPKMGVVFLVMFPVAYTDVSDSWKLPAAERLKIALAGMRVELTIAAWATLIWGLLPPSGLRDGLFLVLTLTWLSTLLINGSPFMRFDGYFVLMDFWRLPNLHQRAAALGRWWLRKLLFGLPDEAPEYLGWLQRRVILFAYLTWSYRLLVMLGIAYIVYELLPQPFGAILAAIEVYWFILAPVVREVVKWPAFAAKSIWRLHFWMSCTGLLLLGYLLFAPWQSSMQIQAVLMPQEAVVVELAEAAQLKNSIVPKGWVKQGQVLADFENPQLRYRKEAIEIELRKLAEVLQQKAFIDDVLLKSEELARRQIELQQQLANLEQDIERLSVRSPLAGYFIPDETEFQPGTWFAREQSIGTVMSETMILRGYLTETDRALLTERFEGEWVSEYDSEQFAVDTGEIEFVAAETVNTPLLLQAAGGDLRARRVEQGWIPETAVYQITLATPVKFDVSRGERLGELRIEAQAHSPWEVFWTQVRRKLETDFGIWL